jgi:polyphosphate glucokinase
MSHTLSIDVGGTGLKAALVSLDGEMVSERVKIKTPYPCPPEVLVAKLKKLTQDFSDYDRVSVGFPGLVREGVVSHVPALSRSSYGGETDPVLQKAWKNYDLRAELSRVFEKPVKVANDADMQGCAVVEGTGFEFVMTLGTGVGSAVFNNGILIPHMELSHAMFRKGESFDLHLGNAARKEIGNERWIDRVLMAITAFDNFLYYDKIHIGGGNSKYLLETPLPPKARIVSNTAGLLGGVRIWDHS